MMWFMEEEGPRRIIEMVQPPLLIGNDVAWPGTYGKTGIQLQGLGNLDVLLTMISSIWNKVSMS